MSSHSIRVYDTKCNIHVTEEIVCICVQCSNKPICFDCFSLGGLHSGHILEKIKHNDKFIKPLIESFKSTIAPTLNDNLNQNNAKIDLSNGTLKEIENEHQSQTDTLKSTFAALHDHLTVIENNLNGQLESYLKENKETNKLQISNIQIRNKSINDILNTINGSEDFSENSIQAEQFNIEMLKFSQQYKDTLSYDQTPVNQIFKKPTLYKDNTKFNTIIDSVNSLFTITECATSQLITNIINLGIQSTHTNSIQEPTITTITTPSVTSTGNVGTGVSILKSKEIKWGAMKVKVYREGTYTIPETDQYIALDQIEPLEYPDDLTRIFLLDGFNYSLISISMPRKVYFLYLFNVKTPIVAGSLPKHITHLTFCDGYSQSITNGSIPPHVTHVYFGDIVKPLSANSIPNTVKAIFITESFKHSLQGVTSIKPTYYVNNGHYEYLYPN